MSFQPFDERKRITRFHARLPHWRQEGSTYFVTFRLADSLPAGKLAQWRSERDTWLKAHGVDNGQPMSSELRKAYHKAFTTPILRWLDEGFGSCRLRKRDAAEVVANAFKYFDGDRYLLGAWVVMPNHIHVLVSPNEGFSIGNIVQSWKSFSARVINRLDGKNGSFWQTEFYDHIVRDQEQFRALERYIAENPKKAKLREGEYLLSEVDADNIGSEQT